MGRELSTSLSDLVLAAAAWKSAIQCLSVSYCATAGFALMATAASFGVIRFFQANPSTSLIRCHTFCSWISSFLGMSMLAAAYHKTDGSTATSNVHLAASLTMLAMHQILSQELREQVCDIMAGAAVISILALCVMYFNPYGLLGSTLVVVSGLVIGTKGYIWKFPRVDVFHYALVVAVIALSLGLTKQPVPAYYKTV